MSTLGRVDEFCVESGLCWTCSPANDIAHGTQTETKCKAILDSTIGEKTYRVLEDLCLPQKPNEKSFEEIKHLLVKHFKLKLLIIAESYLFYNAKQEEGESVCIFRWP